MTFTTEFPDFAPADMPAIPAGFDDVSWRNDTCPSFLKITEPKGEQKDEGKGLILFVDYADESRREFEDSKRFTVHEWDDGTGDVILESDDWADVLAAIASRASPHIESNASHDGRPANPYGVAK